VVLGHPGAGKSVLTKVLAARLSPEEFIPVRVVLRETPAEGEIQDQIEYAIRAATGLNINWPSLVREARPAVPVVLFDGFDELLQATGLSQSDYLARVARFQQREADQGRPLVALVTSRPAEIVARHQALACQPLLLLMLALYDADANALQRADASGLAGALDESALY